MDLAKMLLEAKEQGIKEGIKIGIKKGIKRYKKKCKEIFKNNPPMHFSKKQIMWVKEFAKSRYKQGMIDKEQETKDVLSKLFNDNLIDESSFRVIMKRLDGE